MSLLHELVLIGAPEKKVLRLLRKKQFSVNHQDPDSLQTPLHVACTQGHENLVKLLIKKGGDVNIQDSSGWTALHCSSKEGHLRICEYLLSIKGINVCILTIEKTSVLHYLVRKRVPQSAKKLYVRVLKGILDAGLDQGIRNAHGEAAIHSAVLGGNRDAIEFLLDNGADPDCLTSYGETPLHYAIRSMNKDTLDLLFKYNPDPNIRSENGQTPLDVATEYKAKELIEMLEDFKKKAPKLSLKLRNVHASAASAATSVNADTPGSANVTSTSSRTRSRSKSFDSITRGLVVRSQRKSPKPSDMITSAPQKPGTPSQSPVMTRANLITHASIRAPPVSGGRQRSSTSVEPPAAPRGTTQGISPRALLGDVRRAGSKGSGIAPLPARVLARQNSGKSLGRSKSEIMKKINKLKSGSSTSSNYSSSSLSSSQSGSSSSNNNESNSTLQVAGNHSRNELRRSTSAKLRGVLGSRKSRMRSGSSSTDPLNAQRIEREALIKGVVWVLKRRKWKPNYLVVGHGMLWQFSNPQEMTLLDNWDLESLASVTKKSGTVCGKENCLDLQFVGRSGMRVSSKRQLVVTLSFEQDQDMIGWVEFFDNLLHPTMTPSPRSPPLRRAGDRSSDTSDGNVSRDEYPSSADEQPLARSKESSGGSSPKRSAGMILSSEDGDIIQPEDGDSTRHHPRRRTNSVGRSSLMLAAAATAANSGQVSPMKPAAEGIDLVQEEKVEVTEALRRALERKLSPEQRAHACRVLRVLRNEAREAQPEQTLSRMLVKEDKDRKYLDALSSLSEVVGDHIPVGEEFPLQMVLFFAEHRGDHALNLIRWAIDAEVARTLRFGNLTTPFRTTNLYTSLITAFFFRAEGRGYLIHVLGTDVSRLAKLKNSLEIDPRRAARGVDVRGNLKKVLAEAQAIMARLFASIDVCPIPIRRVLAYAQHVVRQHFPELRRLVVGSFMFLRFVCPALVSPVRYEVLTEEPTLHGLRVLQLIAKLLLNLAHNVEFDASKEAHMIKMNHFITRNMSPLNAFFDRLVDKRDIQDRIRASTVRFNVVQPPEPTVLLAYHEYLCDRLYPDPMIRALIDLRPDDQPLELYWTDQQKSQMGGISNQLPNAPHSNVTTHANPSNQEGSHAIINGGGELQVKDANRGNVNNKNLQERETSLSHADGCQSLALQPSGTENSGDLSGSMGKDQMASKDASSQPKDTTAEVKEGEPSSTSGGSGMAAAAFAGQDNSVAGSSEGSAAKLAALGDDDRSVATAGGGNSRVGGDSIPSAAAGGKAAAVVGENSSSNNPLSGSRYRFFHSHKIKPLVDLWPTKPRPKRVWPEDTGKPREGEFCLVNLKCLERGCAVELGSKHEHYSSENEYEIEDDEMHSAFFFDHLYNHAHLNYIVNPSAHDTDEGPVVITVERSTRGSRGEKLKTIVRFEDGDIRLFLAGVGHGRSRSFTGGMGAIRRKDNYVKYLISACPRLAGVKNALMKVDDTALSDNLLKFEELITIKRSFKFGVLPCPAGSNMTESDMFGTKEISPALQEFLDWFGEKIKLENWTHFRGGLDVKTNTTGTHSYYKEHRGFEIMYHVAPLLPYTEGDEQQLARKRHLGNNIVTIIFNESDHAFDESEIRSHFQHIFLVVRPEGTAQNRRYRVAFVNRAGVDPYGPFLPFPAVFSKDDSARDYLLTKLINGERSAMEAPGFQKGLARTRRTMLEDFCAPYIENKS